MNRWFDNFPILGKYLPGKIILSFFMLLLAVLLAVFIKTSDRIICIFAMLFSFIGDFAMNYPSFRKNNPKKSLILGGIAFIIAHLFYFYIFFTKIQENNFSFFNSGATFAILLLMFITFFMLIKTKSNRRSKLFYFGILYLWITGINYIAIFSYASSVKSIESLAFLGGLLFLTSDVIIGCEQFIHLRSKIARELVWWFYPLGQIILIIMA